MPPFPPPPVVLFDVADTLLYKAGLFGKRSPPLWPRPASFAINRKFEPYIPRYGRIPRSRTERTALFTKASIVGSSKTWAVNQQKNLPMEYMSPADRFPGARSPIFRHCLLWAFRWGIIINWDDRLAGILADHIAVTFDPVVVSGIEGGKARSKIFEIALSKARIGDGRAFLSAILPCWTSRPPGRQAWCLS